MPRKSAARAPTRIACPTCGKSVEWTPESPWRPFCSERCRLIDLGEWFDGQKAIPGEPADVPPTEDPEAGNDP